MSVISHPKVKGGEMRDEREDKSYLYSSVQGQQPQCSYCNTLMLKLSGEKKSLKSTHKENIYPFSKVS